MHIETELSTDKKHCVIRLPARFDVSFSGEFADICRRLPLSVRDIGLDMKEVSYLDATSIAMIVVVHSELSQNFDFYIYDCNPDIARALTVSGIKRLMSVTLKGEKAPGPINQRANDSKHVQHDRAS